MRLLTPSTLRMLPRFILCPEVANLTGAPTKVMLLCHCLPRYYVPVGVDLHHWLHDDLLFSDVGGKWSHYWVGERTKLDYGHCWQLAVC